MIGCLMRLFGILFRLALLVVCISAIIWAIGQLSAHNVIDLAHSWLRWTLTFKNWLDRLAGVKGSKG